MTFACFDMGDTIIPDRIVGLGGVTGTAQAGTVAASSSGNITVGITAVQGASSVGTLASVSKTKGLTGNIATGTGGLLSPIISAAVSAVTGTGSVGTVVAVAFTPVTQSYATPGSYTETIPAGATNVVIEAWGGGAIGANGSGAGCSAEGGGGSGSGAYVRSQYACSGLQTLNLVVGQGTTALLAGTDSTVTSGTLSITTMTAPVGVRGTNGNLGGIGGAGGSPAAGGNVVNTDGNRGFDAPGIGGAGGAGVTGVNGGPAGAGGHGGYSTSQIGRSNGGNGLILLRYT